MKSLTNFIKIIFVLVSFSTSLATSLLAQERPQKYLTISDTTGYFLLDSYLHYYNDEKGGLSIEQISKKQFSDSLHMTQNTKYIWTYFDVKMESKKKWLIDTKNKNDTLYIKENDKWINYTSSNYLYSNIRFILPKLNSDTLERIYMQIIPNNKMRNSGQLAINFEQKYEYETIFFRDSLFYMFVVGIVFGLFFYNLFLAISTKSYSYFIYSIALFSTGIRLLLFSKLFREIVIDYNYISLLGNTFTSLNIIFYTLFSLVYFKEHYRSKWLKIIISLLLFHVLVSSLHIHNTFYYYNFLYQNVGNLSIALLFIALFIFSFYKVKKKALGAKEFLLANIFLIPIILVAIIVDVLLTSMQLVGYIFSMGSVIQLLLFSFALGSRFNLIKKQIAQKENEKLALEKNQIIEVQKITAQKNLELEEKVNQRTAKLQETNKEMQQLIEELDITNESLQDTLAELQLQHNKVTDSIYYANNIQEAILPNVSKIRTVFSDFFVFFRPRDVVSGDFYWYMPLENDRYLIGAFDCTGHGVPGAFMAMISYQILNEIVLADKKEMPNQILDSLRKDLYFALKQHENNNKDGLDACLILIDKKEEKVYFSGAKNPIYYVKNDDPKTLHTIKGTNLYIGGKYNETDKFKLHTISFHQQDTQFYLSSDGIQDQFGGEKNKKLLRKTFKNLLVKNENLSSEEQLDFWDTFMRTWKGQNQQTDDILLIGIRP